MYNELPVLIVKSYEELSKEYLIEVYPALMERMDRLYSSSSSSAVSSTSSIAATNTTSSSSNNLLHREYYYRMIEGIRNQYMNHHQINEQSPRKRCWGPAADLPK